MATHSSILAWRIPRTEEPGGLQFTGSQSRTRLSNYTSTTSADFYVLGFCRLKEGLLATRALQSRIKAAEMLLHAYRPCLPAGALVSVELCLPTILHHPQALSSFLSVTPYPSGLGRHRKEEEPRESEPRFMTHQYRNS